MAAMVVEAVTASIVSEFGCDLSPHFKWVKFTTYCDTAKESNCALARSRYFCLLYHSLLRNQKKYNFDTAHFCTVSKTSGGGGHHIVTQIITSSLDSTTLYFEHTMGIMIAISEILNTKGISSIMLPLQSMMYPQRLFVWANNSNTYVHYQIT